MKNNFKEFWKNKQELTFRYKVTVREKGKIFEESGEVKALSSYDAGNKVLRLLSNKYNNAIYSNYQLQQIS